MRNLVLLLAALPAAAQQPARSQTETYTYDANGQRTFAGRQVAGEGGSEHLGRNINGRVAPLEKVEEKVLTDNGQERVIEKTIRPYDANGAALPAQRIRTTERKQSDGSKNVETQVFLGNINGGFSLYEKTESTERTANGRVTVETQVARPTLNGNLDTVEKRSSTIVKTADKTSEDTLTYRRDTSGNFYAAARAVKETEKKAGRMVENTATYISGDRRQLELSGQVLSETTTRADGSESKQVNVYGMNAPGRPATGQPVLREQQIIEKNKTTNGAVETFSIRRPAVDNPNALGPAQKISEKVCTGPCQ
ncbi:MAG: hypothetical protein HYX27_08720 [Acidobacteria bacterium]|nr:hypothetical protein [Acidobacteriota bacterium]